MNIVHNQEYKAEMHGADLFGRGAGQGYKAAGRAGQW